MRIVIAVLLAGVVILLAAILFVLLEVPNIWLVVVIAAVVVLLGLPILAPFARAALVRARLRREAERQRREAQPEDTKRASSRELEAALAALSRHPKVPNAIHALPWLLCIGGPGQGKTQLLARAGLPSVNRANEDGTITFGAPGVGTMRSTHWWISEKGIVIETPSRSASDEHRAARESFLAMLRQRRPRIPANGIICVVSIDEVLQTSSESRALQLYEELTAVAAELRVCLPVYLVFTKCDRLLGFLEFFRPASEAERLGCFGFTVAFRQPQFETMTGDPQGLTDVWASEATEQRLEDLQNELDARVLARVEHYNEDDRDRESAEQAYAFPAEFEALRGKVVQFVRRLFPPLTTAPMRGLFFTSAHQPKGSSAVSTTSNPGFRRRVPTPAPDGASTTFFVPGVLERVLGDKQLALQSPAALARERTRYRWAAGGVTAVAVLIGALSLAWRESAGDLHAAASAAIPGTSTPVDTLCDGRSRASLERLANVTTAMLDDEERGPLWRYASGRHHGDSLRPELFELFARATERTLVQPLLARDQEMLIALPPAADPGAIDQAYAAYRWVIMTCNEEQALVLGDDTRREWVEHAGSPSCDPQGIVLDAYARLVIAHRDLAGAADACTRDDRSELRAHLSAVWAPEATVARLIGQEASEHSALSLAPDPPEGITVADIAWPLTADGLPRMSQLLDAEAERAQLLLRGHTVEEYRGALRGAYSREYVRAWAGLVEESPFHCRPRRNRALVDYLLTRVDADGAPPRLAWWVETIRANTRPEDPEAPSPAETDFAAQLFTCSSTTDAPEESFDDSWHWAAVARDEEHDALTLPSEEEVADIVEWLREARDSTATRSPPHAREFRQFGLLQNLTRCIHQGETGETTSERDREWQAGQRMNHNDRASYPYAARGSDPVPVEQLADTHRRVWQELQRFRPDLRRNSNGRWTSSCKPAFNRFVNELYETTDVFFRVEFAGGWPVIHGAELLVTIRALEPLAGHSLVLTIGGQRRDVGQAVTWRASVPLELALVRDTPPSPPVESADGDPSATDDPTVAADPVVPPAEPETPLVEPLQAAGEWGLFRLLDRLDVASTRVTGRGANQGSEVRFEWKDGGRSLGFVTLEFDAVFRHGSHEDRGILGPSRALWNRDFPSCH